MATSKIVKDAIPTGDKRKQAEAEALAEDKKTAEKLKAAKSAKPDKAKAEAERKAKAEALKKQKEAEKAKADAEKAKAEAERQKKLEKLVTHANRTAAEINALLERAAKNEKDANDKRLAAALHLAATEKELVEDGGMTRKEFDQWCVEHVKYTQDEVRRMIAIAKAPDPMLALEDHRAAAAERQRKFREKQKAEKEAVKETKKVVAPIAPPLRAPSQPETNTNWQKAEEAAVKLPDTGKQALAEKLASDVGFRVVPEQVAKEYNVRRNRSPLDNAKEAFNSLPAPDKEKFLQWAATSLGFLCTKPV